MGNIGQLTAYAPCVPQEDAAEFGAAAPPTDVVSDASPPETPAPAEPTGPTFTHVPRVSRMSALVLLGLVWAAGFLSRSDRLDRKPAKNVAWGPPAAFVVAPAAAASSAAELGVPTTASAALAPKTGVTRSAAMARVARAGLALGGIIS